MRESKCRSIAGLLVSIVIVAGQSSRASAEDERLVGDPTIGNPGKLIVGVGLGLGYSKGNVFVYDASVGGAAANLPVTKIGEVDAALRQWQFDIFAGYGDFTFMMSGSNASGNASTKEPKVISNIYFLEESNTAITQHHAEYALRWLARPLSTRWFTPYAVIGQTETSIKQIASAGDTGPVNYEYKGRLVGLGAVVPLGRRAGLRVDGRLVFYEGEITVDPARNVPDYKSTGSGRGKDLTVAAYLTDTDPLMPGLGLQAGFKYSTLAGPPDGTLTRQTFFVTVNYTFRD